MRLRVDAAVGAGYPADVTVLDYAVETTPNVPINAGQESSVPEPGTTALLALAGAGAAFLRRKRSKS